MSAWLEAVSAHFAEWQAYISPSLTDSEYDAGNALQNLGTKATVVTDESLHLAVSMRSLRAEHVSRFVKAVLDRDTFEARNLLAKIGPRYPIALTRDLNRAKSGSAPRQGLRALRPRGIVWRPTAQGIRRGCKG